MFTFQWPFTCPCRLKAQGVLGMNQRNNVYIGRYNPRRLFPLVDDKLKTKLLAEKTKIAVPGLIGLIEHQYGIKHIARVTSGHDGFVIKPAKGSGGKGILVIAHQKDGRYYKANGSEESMAAVQRHVSNILAGLYSLGGSYDTALIEELIHFDSCFEEFSFEGVPDVRVIVFKGFPVMAMMRLSTAASDGKANLHQGAVGVGLDIKNGKALNAVQFDKPVTRHPDTDCILKDLQVPHWNELLEMASRCYEMSGLGYLGADMVLDSQKGPMLLELNARPGLSIQIANNHGLLPRLRQIEHLGDHGMDVMKRVAYSQTHFCLHKEQ